MIPCMSLDWLLAQGAHVSKSIAKNTVYNSIRTLSYMLFPLITFPYVTRVLHAENLGKVDFAVSYVSYFALIAALGITNYATREGAGLRDDRDKLSRFGSEVLTINCASTLVAYALLIVSVIAWPHLHGYVNLIAIQAVTIFANTIGMEWLFNVEEDYGYITARTLLIQLFAGAFLFLFIKTPDDYPFYAAVLAIQTTGSNVFNLIRSRKYVRVRLVWDFDPWPHLLPMLILFGSALAVTVCVNIDITFLSALRGDYEVGIYGTAAKVYKMVKQLLFAVVTVSLPRLSYYKANGRDRQFTRLLSNVAHGLMITVFPAVLLLGLLADYVILLIAGESFAESIPLLQILCAALPPAVLATFATNSILLPNKGDTLVLRATILGAVVNTVLNVVAIPLWGATGAAITTAISELTVLVAALWYGRAFVDYREFARSLLSAIRSTTLGIALMVICHLLLRRVLPHTIWSFCVMGMALLAVYALALVVSRDALVRTLMARIGTTIRAERDQS